MAFQDPLFYLAGVTLLLVTAVAVELALGQRRLTVLRNVPPLTGGDAPRLSVIIPARNEAEHIEGALRSVLAQNYPDLEVIALDDRSTDATGEIIDRIAREHSRLRVIHIRELPHGWLGKVHAMHLGAESATGEYLLFTDADVVMEPTAISRAMRVMQRDDLNHLTVASGLALPGVPLNVAVGAFVVLMVRYTRPWKARDPKSAYSQGLGAFNLIRSSCLQRLGGFAPLAMRPDEDVMLGKLVKRQGCRQDFLLGKGMLSVEWYDSARALVQGLRKNAFAAANYRVLPILALTVFVLAIDVWPFVGVVVTSGFTQLLNGLIVLVAILAYWDTAPRYGLNRWLAVAYPAGVLIILYSVWGSVLTTLKSGGITWRDTYYPLEELKAGGAS